MSYPKKFAFINDASHSVVDIQIAWTAEVVFTPGTGITMVEIPMDSQVAIGWSYTQDEDTLQWSFHAPNSVTADDGGATTNAGNGNPPPPTK